MKINVIESRLKLKNMTKDDLAEKIGLSPSAIYRKLKGTSQFRLDEVSKIADVLGFTKKQTYDIFFI